MLIHSQEYLSVNISHLEGPIEGPGTTLGYIILLILLFTVSCGRSFRKQYSEGSFITLGLDGSLSLSFTSPSEPVDRLEVNLLNQRPTDTASPPDSFVF